MEGTRHEKAALVSVAYFIGALTAFIGYGVANSPSVSIMPSSEVAQSASVITAVSRGESVTSKNLVSYEDGVLSIDAIDGTKVLSFNPAVSNFQDNGEFAKQGSHFGNLIYTVASSGEYVFFCEQKAAEGSTCNPFVYDVLLDAIYPVAVENKAVSLTSNAAQAASWNANTLTIDGMRSIGVSTPWLIAK